MVRRQRYYKCAFLVVICILTVCLAGLTGCVSCEGPTPSPVNRIVTTLNPDGISGSNYFEAAWNIEGKTPEELESLQQSVSDISSRIESLLDTRPKTWTDPVGDLLILETTVDFHDPAEIEGILAIIYGLGYARPDISIEIRGPYSTEFKTTWFIKMTVNPKNVPCVENFKWKVNMPAKITDVIVTPDYANVLQSSLGSNISEFTFEPEDQFVTVSVTAEKSETGEKIIWPTVIGIIAGAIGAIIAAIILALFGSWIAGRIRNRRANQRR